MKKIFRFGDCFRWVFVPIAAVACAMLWSQRASAAYIDSVAADFQADSGGSPFGGLPTNNPFGPNSEWTFLGSNGLASGLIKSGGVPASGQPGWCDSTDGVSCTSGGPFTYTANSFWQPGQTIHPGVMGHGPESTVWTAPASVVEGNVSIAGAIEQIFEPTRKMRLSIYKNGNANPFFFVDATPPIVNGVILQPVAFGPVIVPVVPGDKLAFKIFPSPTGNGIPTFINWNVTLTSTAVPESASAMLVAFGGIVAG